MTSTTPTAPAAITVIDAVQGLVEAGSISAGARIAAIGALADEAKRRGFDPHAPIDEDAMDTLLVDAIPARLWMFA